MPASAKDEIIRLSEGITQSIAKLEEATRALASVGRHEEAQAIETAVNGLQGSLARIRFSEDGKVDIVH